MNLRGRLGEPIDAASLVTFRMLFGAMMAFECARYLWFGWVADYWIEPDFMFKFCGFGWVQPWPGVGMYLHFAGLIAAAVALTLGWHARLAAGIFAVGFGYVFLLDQAQYLNHFYAAILFAGLLALMPTAADASVDARRRPARASSTVPRWTVWALRAKMGAIYFWGGIAKLNPDWLAGQPLTMWLQASAHLPDFMKGSAGLYLSWAGAAFDLLVVPALLWRPTRNLALVAAVAFHLANAWMFSIGIFPWMSIAATLMFLDPDHALFRKSIGRFRVGAPARAPATSNAVWATLVLWAVTQAVVPLRPFLYANHVHWTEDGHRFSWHMKLRSKSATGTFWIAREEGGELVRVDPRADLTTRQLDKMLSRPDMIVQYAHFLAQKHDIPAVHVQVFAALNGRAPAPFTDHTVNLAHERRSLLPYGWVRPFQDTPISGRHQASPRPQGDE